MQNLPPKFPGKSPLDPIDTSVGKQQPVKDSAGHGEMTKGEYKDGTSVRNKPTNYVEAFVYMELNELANSQEESMKDKASAAKYLLENMPVLKEVQIKHLPGLEPSEPVDRKNMRSRMTEEGSHPGTDTATIVLSDVVDELAKEGYTFKDILDVKIGSSTFSNREAEFRKGPGQKKGVFNRLQMTFNEAISSGEGYQIASGKNIVSRQFMYAKSKQNLQEFAKGLNEDQFESLIGTLTKMQTAINEVELALIGASILFVKAENQQGDMVIKPFLIDPAHGFFKSETESLPSPRYDDFYTTYQTKFNEGLSNVIGDIEQVSK